MCSGKIIAVDCIGLVVCKSYLPCFLAVYNALFVSSYDAVATTHLILGERLATFVNCGLTTLLCVVAIGRLRGVHLHVHPTLRKGSIHAVSAIASLAAGVLALAHPGSGSLIWVLDSCLLLTGSLLLYPGFRCSGLNALIVTGGLCWSASAELIVRVFKESHPLWVVGVPCIFWLCGLLQLGLWCDDFLPLVLCESLAARRQLQWCVPMIPVVPVASVLIARAAERLGYCDRDSGEAITALISWIVVASLIAFSAKLLRQVERGFWNLFDDGDEAILMAEPTTLQIKGNNAKAAKLFDSLAERPESHSLENLFRMVPAEQLRSLKGPLSRGPRRNTLEVRWKDSSDREYWLELWGTLTPFRGTDMLLVHARDISERKNMQLAQSQTEKMRALGQLAGGIAHEFQNLLQGIRMCSESLEQEIGACGDSRELLKQINSSIESSQRLAEWLGAYCRRARVSYQPTDLNRLIVSVAALLKRTLGSGIIVQTDLSEQSVEVTVDRAQIEEVLLSLALNARDAMPDGGTLTLQTQVANLNFADGHAPPRAGRYVLLSVIDTGIGMNEETTLRAFEPFFTTRQPGCGTGLGLAVTYAIVAQSGGSIRLESAVGKGTRVRIYLPARDGSSTPGTLSNDEAVA